MRAFWAVDAGERFKEFGAFLAAKKIIEKGLIPAKNYHVTLNFLGNIPAGGDNLKVLFNRAAGAAAVGKFSVSCNKAGAFKHKNGSCIVWLGLQDKTQGLAKLAKALNANGNFAAHITVARLKRQEGADELLAKINALKNDFGVIEHLVENFSLYSSTLTPEGSKYEIVKTFNLT